MGIGFPNQLCRGGEFGHKLERRRQVNGRFPSQQHDRAGAFLECAAGFCRHGWWVKSHAGARVPTWPAGDAEIAAQIASAERNGESRHQFQLIGQFELRAEEARFGAGMAKAVLANEPVNAAMVGAEMAIGQHVARELGASAGDGGASFLNRAKAPDLAWSKECSHIFCSL